MCGAEYRARHGPIPHSPAPQQCPTPYLFHWRWRWRGRRWRTRRRGRRGRLIPKEPAPCRQGPGSPWPRRWCAADGREEEGQIRTPSICSPYIRSNGVKMQRGDVATPSSLKGRLSEGTVRRDIDVKRPSGASLLFTCILASGEGLGALRPRNTSGAQSAPAAVAPLPLPVVP